MTNAHIPRIFAGYPVRLQLDTPPSLTVIVDTEEEFDWSAAFSRDSRATSNILLQTMAQEIMDRHGVIPTYVVDYAVADTEAAYLALRSIADDNRCEIGAHLHPWINPPYEEPLNEFHSFPGNLPMALEREKISRLAIRIEETFGSRPTIYKAGRYGVGPATFGTLAALGFRIDVSVVPHTNFSELGGPDFTLCPSSPFQAGPKVVALPLSVHFVGAFSSKGRGLHALLSQRRAARLHLPGISARLRLLERLRLSPEGHSLNDMKRQTRAALARGERYFMLTYHSSTLLPGATAYAPSEFLRDQFLEKLDQYLSFFLQTCGGRTMSTSALAASLCPPAS